MSIAQTVVYKLKNVTQSGLGRSLNRLAKIAAGLYFDVFVREYRTAGLSFVIPRDQTNREMRGKFTVDTCELPERTLIERHMPPGASVLELGAYIGVVSCFINRRLALPARHLAVEANPYLIDALSANRERNQGKFDVLNSVISRDPVAFVSTDKTMDSNSLQSTGMEVKTMTVEQVEQREGWQFDTLV